MATSYLGVDIPTFWDQYGFQEDSGTVVKSADEQLVDWIKEQNRRAALTPAQRAIEDARYVENLEGGNETRYNPVKYGGKEYMVGPSGDTLVSLADDQSGLSGKQYRTEILDPATGQKSFQVTEDKGLWKRFLQDLPKIAAGVGFVVGLPTFLESAGSALSSLGGSAGAGSGSLASNLTVGEAASAITNPLQVVTKPITNTITDYIVGTINSNALAGVEMLPGVADQVLLSAGEKALIKTGAAAFVNGVTSELLGGDFKQGAVGTVAGTILNSVPIPGSGDLLGTNKDVSFTSLISNLVDRGLSEVGIADQLTDKLSAGVSKGATAGITTAIAGGDSNDILRNTGIGALMGTLGDTKIPGTKLTGDDALELIQDSFADGSDATAALNNAAGKVVVKADANPLDQLDPTDFFAGSGFGGEKTSVTGGFGNDTIKPYDANVDANAEDVSKAYLEILGRAGDAEGVKFWDETGLGLNDIINMFKGSDEYKAKTPSTTVTAGSGNDTLGEDSVSITGGGGNAQVSVTGARDSIGDTISDYIDLGGNNDLVTSGSGNDSINAGAVEVTGASDPCENPNQVRDPITGGCYDPIDYILLGAGNDSVPAGAVTVTGGNLNDSIGADTVGDIILDGSGNDTCPPGQTRGADGKCAPTARVTVTAADCDAKGMGYDPKTNSCYELDWETLFLGTPKTDTLPGGGVTVIGSNDSIGLGSDNDSITLGSGNDTIKTDTCPAGQTRGTDGICRPQLEVTAKKCNEDQYKGADGSCYCLDPDQAPNSLGLCQDTTSDIITVGGGNDTVKGGGGNDTITECPTGYTFSSKTGKCEFDPIGLPSLFKNLTTGGDGPASYTPNLTQPFTASRSYTKPPDTYDYAGADTVGYEDPYFQRFGPIVYTPPAGYLGAGVQPSPAGGTDTDTVDGAGVDTSGGGLAYGGLLSLARGGRTLPPRYLGGITDGMADRVPAHIDGKRPAALSDGEFVIPADVVSHLGNGNSSAGAKILYEMMDRVRKARTGTKKQGREIDAQRFMPR